jgi:hypothetical protein
LPPYLALINTVPLADLGHRVTGTTPRLGVAGNLSSSRETVHATLGVGATRPKAPRDSHIAAHVAPHGHRAGCWFFDWTYITAREGLGSIRFS